MGLFKKKTNEPVSNDMELNDTVNGSMDTELQESDKFAEEKLDQEMENNVVEEDDEIFFDALDYMTAPERNYLANIQRGTMSKEKLFTEMRAYFEDVRIKMFGKRFSGNVKFRDANDYRRFVDIVCSRNKVNLSDLDAIQIFTDIDSNDKFRLRFNLTSSIINCNKKPVVHIRKIPKHKKSLYDLAHNVDIDGNPYPMFPEELIPFLIWMAEESSGIEFTGKGASGKTTLMNGMLDVIPEYCSGAVIQESDELFSDHPDMMYQHVIQNRGESKIKYTLKDLATNGLLTDLDYFIIGEIKGGEAAYFMNAAYTGHKCWSSVHGVSSTEAMNKLADYVKYETDYSREDILRMLHYMRFVIFMKDYRIEEISEVVGYSEEIHDLVYRPVYKRGEFFKDPREN